MKRLYSCWMSLIGCALGLAGCTANLVEENVPEEAQLIGLCFGRPDLGTPELLTRAADDVTPLPAGATVRVVAYYLGRAGEQVENADFSTNKPYGEATFVVGEGGSLTPCQVDQEGRKIAGEAEGLMARTGIYDFYAVSPARPLQKNEAGFWAIKDLPHREDIMTSYARNVVVTKSNPRITLQTFVRRSALVVFTVAPAPDNMTPFVSLEGTALTLTGVSRSGAELKAGVNESIVKTGAVAGDAGKLLFSWQDFVPVATASDPDRLKLNKVVSEILPKDGQPFRVAITVKRDRETVDLEGVIDKNITFDEGKRYVFTLLVYNDISRLNMKVLEWNTIVINNDMGGRAAVRSKSGEFLPDPDICEGFGVPEIVAEWKHPDWSGKTGI